MKKSYVNDFIAIWVNTYSNINYSVPTYENINSITIISRGTTLYIGVNSPYYLSDTYKIEPGNSLKIGGKYNEKINAPFTLYADNIAPNGNPGYMYIILKRYID
jgi:hypothetical protein